MKRLVLTLLIFAISSISVFASSSGGQEDETTSKTTTTYQIILGELNIPEPDSSSSSSSDTSSSSSPSDTSSSSSPSDTSSSSSPSDSSSSSSPSVPSSSSSSNSTSSSSSTTGGSTGGTTTGGAAYPYAGYTFYNDKVEGSDSTSSNTTDDSIFELADADSENPQTGDRIRQIVQSLSIFLMILTGLLLIYEVLFKNNEK